MLITVEDFIDSGLKISNDVSDKEISFAIKTIEYFYLKERLTDANYISLSTNPTESINYILLNGGVIDDKVYGGLKYALCHLVYAYLMSENMRITRYSTVEKKSEFSNNSQREDILEQARMHMSIGDAAVREVMDYYQLDSTHNIQNNLFETIIY